jgi:hypothetical protein
MAKKRGSVMNTAPISTRALVQRINRALAKDDEILKACRPTSRAYHELGDYYIVNFNMNAVMHKDVGIEALGKELGVLKEFERLEDE